MVNSVITSDSHELKQIPVWKNASFWHITFLMAACSVFYYIDVIVDYEGWVNLRWGIFYTVHDLHRALFLIPAMYATYKFRLKGIIATTLLSFLIFLPRALAVSPYPNPLLRALIFTISMIIMGVFLSLLLNNITKRKELEKGLWQAQKDLLLKQAEESLLKSEARYRSLFENMSEGFAYCRMLWEEGKPADFVYLEINASFEKLTGLKNAKGKRVSDLISDIQKEDQELFEIYGRVALTGKPERTEIFVKALNMWFSISVYSPQKEYFISIFDVITERKRAEEEIIKLNAELEQKVAERTSELHDSQLALLNLVDDLNQSAKNTDLINRKLEETNKELGAFSYSVSHDLRAPLRSIDGFSLALLEDYEKKLDDTGKDYLHKIRAATQHMGLLIEDMLKLSRITHAEFHHQSINLSKIVQSISETFQQNNPGYDMKMIIQKGIVIKGDPNSMEIALTNLLENAWKFTGKQKHPLIEFGMTLTEGKKIFFIRDNGAGFDMAYVDKLFGAFQRLHSTNEFPGTGIGLATVKRIITRHGGQIWAEGAVGKGAVFYFTLP